MIDYDFNNLLSKSGVVLQKIKISVIVIKSVLMPVLLKEQSGTIK